MSNSKDAPAKVSPLAGKPATPAMLVDVPRLVTAYYTGVPDPSVQEQRVAFGTSGHRGSSFRRSFNEWHIRAISQAICDYRKRQGIGGPLFLGIDTHALSVPASASALEVLAANGVEVMLASNDEYTPTPVISHAILTYNRGRDTGLADGIVITPRRKPPATADSVRRSDMSDRVQNEILGLALGRGLNKRPHAVISERPALPGQRLQPCAIVHAPSDGSDFPCAGSPDSACPGGHDGC
jgi:hypothetical protein